MSASDPIALLSRLQDAVGDRYSIERELARGAMARVYLAREGSRRVAIKLLPPELAAAGNAERFLREIRITSGLDHPNILPLLDSGAAGPLCWYVMPFVDGESLRGRLASGPLPIPEVVTLATEVCAALEHAHGRGVVHRDLKPENLMRQGQRWVVLDFGLARAIGGEANLTGAGMPLGTPAYMSPEQITGAAEVDARADIYGLGCVLFEALTGRPPFSGPSVIQVLQAHMRQAPVPPSRLRPGIPAGLDQAVLTSLSKNQADRPQSAAEYRARIGSASQSAAPGPEDGPGAMLVAGTRARDSKPAPAAGLLSRLFGRRP